MMKYPTVFRCYYVTTVSKLQNFVFIKFLVQQMVCLFQVCQKIIIIIF